MTRWFLLPGMGATAAIYDSLRSQINFDINFIDWPEYKGENTYSEVASKVIDNSGIKSGDIIGGSSLGGMVALEIAKQIKTTAVILIGSAISRHEVQKLLEALSPLAQISPLSLIQTLVGKHDSIVAQMFAGSDPNFIRSMCLHLSNWEGYSGPHDNIFRIHGRKDHVISCQTSGAEFIEQAGHLLAFTHAKECAKFLNKTNQHLTNH